MKTSLSLISLTQVSLSTFSIADAQIEQLDPVIVTGLSGDPVLSKKKAELVVKETPGQVEIVDPEDWSERGHSLADVFELAPSVRAEAEGSANETTLSVRGSGAQSSRGNRGLTILQDGVPSGSIDGKFVANFLDPVNLQRAQVFPGANGFAQGATQFGGAIDFQLKNGLSDPGGLLKVDYGSYETVRTTLQYGGLEGAADYFISLGHLESNGYRDISSWDSNYLMSNVGYKWSDVASTRVYFSAVELEAQRPGGLTRAQFEDDPQQAREITGENTGCEVDHYRVAQRTNWRSADTEVTFFSYYQNSENHNFGETLGPRPSTDSVVLEEEEFGFGVRAEHRWVVAGLEQKTKASVGLDIGENQLEGFRGPREVNQKDNAENLAIYVENQTSVTKKHKVLLGLGWTTARRTHEDRRSVPPRDLNDYSESQDGGIWRVGYLYDVAKGSQLFGNVSQSFEAQPFSIIDRSGKILSPQKAVTLEVGSRFKKDWVKGAVVAYHSKVDGEFIAVEEDDGARVRPSFTNEDTTHRGVEVALELNLTDALTLDTDYKLLWDSKYQLNDFEFEGGEFEGNRMPGISPHIYSSRLKCVAPERKWSAELSVRYQPEGLIADNANTIHVGGFATWRCSADYKVNDVLSFYGGIDNLFDKQHIRRVALNPRGASHLNPAEGRTAYIGAKLLW